MSNNLILLFLIVTLASCNTPNLGLNLEQRCERFGYQYEEHQVVTEDGYHLTIFRIPGRIGEETDGKPPIYLSKPFFGNFQAFFYDGPDNAPGFYFTRHGLDVWMTSFRGNRNSREHDQYTVNDEEFWDFTASDYRFDHMAAIDYILENTAFEQTYAYGFSTGAETLSLGFALEPEFFSERVRIAFLAGDTVSVANTGNVGIVLAGEYPIVFDMARMFGNERVAENNPFLGLLLQFACSPFPMICDIGQGLFLGDTNINGHDQTSALDQMVSGNEGVSIDALDQAFQSARTGEVTELDYGAERNMEEYGQETPPRIPLENTQTPLILFQGNQDATADEIDTQWYIDQLDDDIFMGINYYDYDHLSFIAGNNMEPYLEDIIEACNQYPLERTPEE